MGRPHCSYWFTVLRAYPPNVAEPGCRAFLRQPRTTKAGALSTERSPTGKVTNVGTCRAGRQQTARVQNARHWK